VNEDIQFPEALEPLFSPARYKVAYGGRGGAKSWGFARALLILGAQSKLRILCTREVQKSIEDSVHKLLSDQIEKVGLLGFYDVQARKIKGSNGTEFLFAGLSDITAANVKSFEGVDIVWCEEAQAISKNSWNTLIPTIRKEDDGADVFKESEIWISFNPDLDTDETYVRFVTNPPPGAVLMPINYGDNPWFPSILEKERVHAKATMPKAEYENIWEGKCKPAVTGAIYAEEIGALRDDGRICDVAYDPAFKVHVIWDLGWNDMMALILVQRHLSTLRVIEYLEDSHKTLDWWSTELKTRRYNWGKLWLPHDGAHGDYKTGKSAEKIMQELGWETSITPSQPVETGIRTARMALARTYIDKTKAARLVECLKRYRRGIPATTGEPGAPRHDEFSHGADAYRYLAINAEYLHNHVEMPALTFETQFTHGADAPGFVTEW
jgi:phage terminase large subunit